MSADVDENHEIEEVVFRCLSETDPESEFDRLTADKSVGFRDRARRIMLQVREDESSVDDPAKTASSLHSIAGCRILRKLASGGMGTVYLAEQLEPVRRRVALKVIRPGMASEIMLRRFELERQALALMDHDNIAKIFEAGTTDAGEPYFLMEYVPGQPIHEYCDKNRLSTRARLELFEQACSAVQHAHQRGIIHRDLKSANILVTDTQSRPVPKIIDFGLARPTTRQLMGATLHTQHGMLVGTPAYMSPEQAEMSSAEVDTRTDIYSLGVVLYELLTGSLPLSEEDLCGTAAEIQRKISETDCPRPSARLSTLRESSSEIAKNRQSSTAALTRVLRSDLDWVVMRALERDRNRRYATASEFGADVRRYLAGEPVLAGPPGLAYRVRKFAGKHKGRVAAGATIVTALVVGAVVSAILYFDMRESAREAARQKAAAEESERHARESLDRFDLLRYRIELDDAIAEAARLYPAWPERVPQLRSWVQDNGEKLRRAGPVVESALERIAQDGRAEPPSSTTRFLQRTLSRLHEDIDAFLDPETGVAVEVAERLEWAESVDALTIERYRDRWERARLSILRADGQSASSRYRTDPPLELAPQVGLVPIGMNPATGLWEFYHLRSAAEPDVIPEHGSEGGIEVDGETGIVFVLVPMGTFTMGVQKTDPDGINYDPFAIERVEGPPKEVTVEPFFLARHELTQGQWRRLARGTSASLYTPGFRAPGMAAAVTEAHPVESTNHGVFSEVLARHGLTLPGERQWAWACRAGTEMRWSTGDAPESLAGFANILDRTAFRANPSWGEPEAFDDGFVIHAPVGSFSANPFGIHDLYGNVWEWCRPRDDEELRTARGGGFNGASRFTRTGYRWQHSPQFSTFVLGARAAREIRAP